MKKIFTIFAAAAALLLVSCAKDPIGGTAVQDLSGEWYVEFHVWDEANQAIDENATKYLIENYGCPAGHFIVSTYNTVENSSTEMWINDNGEFWPFAATIKCDLKTKTFGSNDECVNYAGDPDEDTGEMPTVIVYDGKIQDKLYRTPHGGLADAFECKLKFSDDPGMVYLFSGWRYTGFVEDED